MAKIIVAVRQEDGVRGTLVGGSVRYAVTQAWESDDHPPAHWLHEVYGAAVQDGLAMPAENLNTMFRLARQYGYHRMYMLDSAYNETNDRLWDIWCFNGECWEHVNSFMANPATN